MAAYSIDSYDEFRRLLEGTHEIVRDFLALTPGFTPVENIHRQLEAVSIWTTPGQTVTQEQKDSIDFGLVAARELDDSSDPEIQDLANRLHALSGFFDRSF